MMMYDYSETIINIMFCLYHSKIFVDIFAFASFSTCLIAFHLVKFNWQHVIQ